MTDENRETGPSGAEPKRGEDSAVEQLLRAVTPVVWVTPAIAAILLFIHVGTGLYLKLNEIPEVEGFIRLGGSFGPMYAEGEWWRLLSATLLHAGFGHVAFNVWALWSAGQLTERIYGNVAFLGIYLLSGIGASLWSVAVQPMGLSVGASGAVFGVYGALLAFVLTHRGVLPPETLRAQRTSLFFFLGYNLVFGLVAEGIDLAAHIGGLVTGGVVGLAMSRNLERPRERRGRRVLSALGIAVLLLVSGAGVRSRLENVPEIRAQQLGEQAAAAGEAGRSDEAIALLTRAIALSEEARWYAIRGVMHAMSDSPTKAFDDWRRAGELEADPEVRVSMCHAAQEVASEAGQRKRALEVCAGAVETNPNDGEVFLTRAKLHMAQSNHGAAVADAARAFEISGGTPVVLRTLVAARLLGDKHEEALPDCRRLMQATEASAFDYSACGTIALHLNELDLAAEWLGKGAKAFPENTHVLGVASAAHLHRGHLDRAGELLDRTLAISPDDPTLLNNRAWIRVGTGEFARARVEADRSLELRPDDPNTLGTRCFALVGLGERAAAREDCERAVALNPDDIVDKAMLAYLRGRRAEAARSWRKVAKDEPSSAKVLEPWIERAERR